MAVLQPETGQDFPGIGHLGYCRRGYEAAKIQGVETALEETIEIFSFFRGWDHSFPTLHGIPGAFNERERGAGGKRITGGGARSWIRIGSGGRIEAGA